MKKHLYIIMCMLMLSVTAWAGEGDQHVTVNAGFLFNSTLNASVGYEKELKYGDAIELFSEAGDRWHKDPVCGKVCNESFWKAYYWDGGIVYKKSMKKYKNSLLRFRFGPVFGAHTGDYFFGLDAGFEYSYIFPNEIRFTVTQKNNVNFLHGDSFRNGLLVGVSIPF